MGYQKRGYKKNFKKKRKEKEMQGLCVEVWNNNIETALKIFKRKVKDSKLLFELKEKQYYKKPSEKRREKKAIAKARYRVRPVGSKKTKKIKK